MTVVKYKDTNGDIKELLDITGTLERIATLEEHWNSISPAVWHSGSGDTLTITVQRDCNLDIELSVSKSWGVGGGLYSVSIGRPSTLVEVAKFNAYGSSGDTIGRQMIARVVLSGAKAGQTYTFTANIANGGGFSDLSWIAKETSV